MELDAALTTLKAATASVVDALREADLAGLSREQLVSVVETAHRTSNTMSGLQTVAIAHVAAVEDNVNQHGAWLEQHRGLGHVSLDAPGLIAPVLGLSAQAASTLVDLAVHQVSRTPRLVGAMLSGDLDPWRARVVTTEVEIIPKDSDSDSGSAYGCASDSDAAAQQRSAESCACDLHEADAHDADCGEVDYGEADDPDSSDHADVPGAPGAPDAAGEASTDAEFGPGDAAADLVDDLFGHYEDRGRGWHETAGPLRGRVRRMVARAHPDLIEKEAAEAREGRGVRRSPATVGTDHWAADLPVEVSLPMWQAVEALARELKSADPSLKIDQARADALAQLVLQQADITVHLHGTIPDGSPAASTSTPETHRPAERRTPQPETTSAATSAANAPAGEPAEPDAAEPGASEPDASAAGASEPDACAAETASPGASEPDAESPPTSAGAGNAGSNGGQLTEVGGLGSTQPTLLDLDRLAAARGVRVMPSTSLTCHPDTGAVIGGVVPASLAKLARKDAARRSDKYVVPTDMARLVRLRDGRCRFPNCMIPASKTDQDHVIAWPVGETTPTNLMCLCRRHHRVKQRRGWQVRLDPDGVVHWIDPTGRATVTYPINHLDRISLPLRSHTPADEEADPPSAETATQTDVTFREIARTHLRDLDEIPTAFEDHLWRHLETTHRGSTLGETIRPAEPDNPSLSWWHTIDRLTLTIRAGISEPARAPVPDCPPF